MHGKKLLIGGSNDGMVVNCLVNVLNVVVKNGDDETIRLLSDEMLIENYHLQMLAINRSVIYFYSDMRSLEHLSQYDMKALWRRLMDFHEKEGY